MEENNIEYDDSPAFHKMGYDDVKDYVLKEMKKKYIERYICDVKRRQIGGSKNIHMPEIQHNPPTPLL
jgi:hypothetical protein